MSLDTEWGSIYSLISNLTICDSLSNNASAKLLHTSVLPTPVGPRNKKEPIGLFSSLIPDLCLIIASLTNVSASSWPITLLASVSFNPNNFYLSPWTSLETGILVDLEIISAISFSVTTSDIILFVDVFCS